MLDKSKIFLGFLIVAVIFTGCVTEKQGKEEINFSAAASLKDAGEELITLYEEKNPEVRILGNYASSGALMTQIAEGAQVDIFFSAGKKQVDTLIEKGLIEEDKFVDLIMNQVVLITNKDKPYSISSFGELRQGDYNFLAMGDPQGVPVGQYSKEILDALDLYEEVKGKINFGKDVRQVLDWVAQGEIDLGLVYKTDALIEDKVDIVLEAPQETYSPAIYPLALVGEKIRPEVADFYAFLQSKEAMEIYESYGFQGEGQ